MKRKRIYKKFKQHLYNSIGEDSYNLLMTQLANLKSHYESNVFRKEIVDESTKLTLNEICMNCCESISNELQFHKKIFVASVIVAQLGFLLSVFNKFTISIFCCSLSLLCCFKYSYDSRMNRHVLDIIVKESIRDTNQSSTSEIFKIFENEIKEIENERTVESNTAC